MSDILRRRSRLDQMEETVEENVSEVKFVGQPPFTLPEAKSAQAGLFEQSVVITLFSVVEGQGPGPLTSRFTKGAAYRK